MAKATISGDDIALGRAVLLATDAVGLSPEGAFWISDESGAKGGFYLVTSLFDTIKTRELFLRLSDAFREKLSEEESENFVFFIAGPEEAIVDEVRMVARTSELASYPRVYEAVIGGMARTLVVYRMADTMNSRGVHRANRIFKRLTDGLVPA